MDLTHLPEQRTFARHTWTTTAAPVPPITDLAGFLFPVRKRMSVYVHCLISYLRGAAAMAPSQSVRPRWRKKTSDDFVHGVVGAEDVRPRTGE